MALQTAVINGKAKAAEFLLKNLEDLPSYSVSLFNMYPPLFNAAFFGKTEVAEILLMHGFEANATFSSEQITPLALAIEKRHVGVVEVLLKNGADANAVTSSEKQTPLIAAIRKEDVEIVRLLLEYGADPLLGRKTHTVNFAKKKPVEELRLTRPCYVKIISS